MTTIIKETEKNGYLVEMVQEKNSPAYMVKVYNLATGRKESESIHGTLEKASRKFKRVAKSI